MKKILLSVLAVAVTIVACNRYDDDFDALNQKLQDLEQKINTLEELRSQVTNLQTNVGALAAGLQGVGAQVAGLSQFSAAVTAILGDISDLQAALDAASSDAEVAALTSSLNDTLAELQTLVESNGTMLGTVLAAVADNKEVLDSLVTALADIDVDLSAVLAALGTSDDFDSVMDAFSKVLAAITTSTATNASNLEDAIAAIIADNDNTRDVLSSIVDTLSDVTSDLSDISTAQAANLLAITNAIAANLDAIGDVQDSVDGIEITLAGIVDNIATMLENQGNIEDDIADALAQTLLNIGNLSSNVSSNQTALINALNGISSQNSAIQAAIAQILALQVTYTGDLYITNSAELDFATALGTKVEYLNGDLFVAVTAANGLDAADVNAVVSQIKAVVSSVADPGNNNAQGDVSRVSIVTEGANALDFSSLVNISGDLTIRTTGTSTIDLSALAKVTGQVSIGATASHDLSSLTTVTGDYYVSGKDINDSSLATVGGNVTLNYDGGYTQPSLATVTGGLFIVDYATVAGTSAGTLAVDFTGLTSVSNFATITSEDAAAHHSGGGSSAGTSTSTTNAPTGGTAYTLNLRAATSIKIGQAAVVSITAPKALDIDHNFTGTLSTLDITAVLASTIDVADATVTGATTVTSGTDTAVTILADTNGLNINDGKTITISNTASAGTSTFDPVATATVNVTSTTIGTLVADAGAGYTVSATTIGVLDFNAGSTISVTGDVTGSATFDAAAAAAISLTGDYSSTLDINGSNAASVVITGDTVTGAADITVAADGSISASSSFPAGVTTTGGDSVSLTGSSASNVDINSVANDGSVTVNNTITGTLGIDGSESVSLGMATIGGAVTIAMGDTDGSVSAPSLTTLSSTITADALSISVPSLVTITGGATFATATGLSFPELVSASTITAASSVSLTAPKFMVTSLITMKDIVDAAVVANTPAELRAIVKSTTSPANFARANDWLDIKFNELASDFNSAGYTRMTTLNVTGKDSTVDVDIDEDNAKLASLTFNGSYGNLAVGTATAGLNSLVSFTTASGSTLKSLTVQNTTALTGMSLAHTEDSPDGISVTIDGNAKLASFTTSADRAFEFIVTDNPLLTGFNASSYTTIPADTESDGVGDDIDFIFRVTGNTSLTGTKVDNDATNDQSFTQASLSTVRDYIIRAFAGVAADNANTINNGSTITVDLSYIDTATSAAVQTDDLTGTGSIDDLVEVSAIN
jgi:hypothetical protein